MLKYREQWKRRLTLMHCISTREVYRVNLRPLCVNVRVYIQVIAASLPYVLIGVRGQENNRYIIKTLERELGELEFSLDQTDIK